MISMVNKSDKLEAKGMNRLLAPSTVEANFNHIQVPLGSRGARARPRHLNDGGQWYKSFLLLGRLASRSRARAEQKFFQH